MSWWRHNWRQHACIDYPCGSFGRTMQQMILLKYGLIPRRTVGEEAFWLKGVTSRVWRHRVTCPSPSPPPPPLLLIIIIIIKECSVYMDRDNGSDCVVKSSSISSRDAILKWWVRSAGIKHSSCPHVSRQFVYHERSNIRSRRRHLTIKTFATFTTA